MLCVGATGTLVLGAVVGGALDAGAVGAVLPYVGTTGTLGAGVALGAGAVLLCVGTVGTSGWLGPDGTAGTVLPYVGTTGALGWLGADGAAGAVLLCVGATGTLPEPDGAVGGVGAEGTVTVLLCVGATGALVPGVVTVLAGGTRIETGGVCPTLAEGTVPAALCFIIGRCTGTVMFLSTL